MEILTKIGYAVCHQLSSRSIFIDAKQLPVCARDTGLYFGSLLSLIYILVSRKRKTNAIPTSSVSFLFVFFMLLLAVDGVSSYLGFRETTNAIRLVTGLLVGITFPFFLYPLLIDNLMVKTEQNSILKSWYEVIPLLLLVFLSFLLIMRFNVNLYLPISIFLIIGILLLHYLMIATLVSLFFSDLYSKNKTIKPLLIFPSAFVLLNIEFIILTKLHNLVK